MKTILRSTRYLILAVTLCLAVACLAESPKMKMTTDIPASITAPENAQNSLGTLEYFDGVPTGDTVDKVYDYLDRSRAVMAVLSIIPGLGATIVGLLVLFSC